MHFLRYYIIIFISVFTLSKACPIPQNQINAADVLVKIESAFNDGDVTKISEFIDNKTYFSFTPDLSGYFSYSQVYNLLKDYFEVYDPIKFRFMSKNIETNSPFGWGELIYMKNGVRGTHKIFISLQHSEQDFNISQISIN